MLGHVPAGADAENEAAAGELIDSGRHAGEQAGMAKGHRANECAEADAARVFGHMDQRDERLEGVPVRLNERQKVVGTPERLETEVLRRPHDFVSQNDIVRPAHHDNIGTFRHLSGEVLIVRPALTAPNRASRDRDQRSRVADAGPLEQIGGCLHIGRRGL